MAEKDEWIDERIASCQRAADILDRMSILEEIHNNKKVVITSHQSFTKGRRSLVINGPKELIKSLEKLM